MTVTPSPLVSSGAVPSSPLSVRAPQFLYRPDWADVINIVSSWKTSVNRARSGHEQRRGYIARPSYGLRANFWGFAEENRIRQLMSGQERHALSRSLCPLYPDKVRLTNAKSGLLSGDFSNRRFFTGGRIALTSTNYDLLGITTVTSVTDTTLGVADATSAEVGGFALPMSEAELQPSLGGRVLSAGYINGEVSLNGTHGPGSLDPAQTPGSPPSEYPTYCTLPVWHPIPIDWDAGVSYVIRSAGTLGVYGLSTVPSLYASPPVLERRMTLLLEDREAFWKFRRLWDYAAGRLFSFMVVDPTIDLFAIDTLTNGMRFQAVGAPVDWDSCQYVAFLNRGDNPVQIRKVASVVSSGGGEYNDVTFSTDDGDGPFTDLALEQRFAIARRMRFAEDTLVERWLTDGTCRIDVGLVEVPLDESVIVPNLDVVTDTTTTCTPTTTGTTTTGTTSSSTSVSFTSAPTFITITTSVE